MRPLPFSIILTMKQDTLEHSLFLQFRDKYDINKLFQKTVMSNAHWN